MSKKTVKDVLVDTRALLENPDAWIKLAYAQDSDYGPVNPNDTSACAWCASGAVFCVYDQDIDIQMPMLSIRGIEEEDKNVLQDSFYLIAQGFYEMLPGDIYSDLTASHRLNCDPEENFDGNFHGIEDDVNIFNDHERVEHKDVLMALDWAIENCRK